MLVFTSRACFREELHQNCTPPAVKTILACRWCGQHNQYGVEICTSSACFPRVNRYWLSDNNSVHNNIGSTFNMVTKNIRPQLVFLVLIATGCLTTIVFTSKYMCDNFLRYAYGILLERLRDCQLLRVPYLVGSI